MMYQLLILEKNVEILLNKWINVHKDQFKRLGVIGDWENYYSTMSFDAEAQIVRELGKFLKEGSLYRGYKPVLWSTVEKTALADAEVEYMDHVSDTIYSAFPIKKTNIKRNRRFKYNYMDNNTLDYTCK